MCTQETLIGYLLDALDEHERVEIERRLADSPQLRLRLTELRKALSPLNEDAAPLEPPEGLAMRTCRFVAERDGSQSMAYVAGENLAPGFKTLWTLTDVIVAAGVVVAASLLFFPALLQSKYNASLARCEENMRQLYMGMAQYATVFSGQLPVMPPDRQLSFVGMTPVVLLDTGYLANEHSVRCPGVNPSQLQLKGLVAQSIESELVSKDDRRLLILFRRLPDGYAYNVGRIENNRYVPMSFGGCGQTPLLADCPSDASNGAPSDNHGGRVYNVLYQSGCVKRYCTKRKLADDPYRSERGRVEIPMTPSDFVLGSSAWKLSSPFPLLNDSQEHGAAALLKPTPRLLD